MDTPPPPPDRALRVATTLARWLDGRLVDPLLGLLLPGIGDVIGSALGIYVVLLAWRQRAPKVLLARMLLNLAADAAGGAVPLLGDLWDFLFRAHKRNLALLQDRTTAAGDVRSRRSDTLVVAGAALALLVALALPVLVVVGLWRVLASRS